MRVRGPYCGIDCQTAAHWIEYYDSTVVAMAVAQEMQTHLIERIRNPHPPPQKPRPQPNSERPKGMVVAYAELDESADCWLWGDSEKPYSSRPAYERALTKEREASKARQKRLL